MLLVRPSASAGGLSLWGRKTHAILFRTRQHNDMNTETYTQRLRALSDDNLQHILTVARYASTEQHNRAQLAASQTEPAGLRQLAFETARRAPSVRWIRKARIK